jgi:tetratricopeptide (TPR) repeat protein
MTPIRVLVMLVVTLSLAASGLHAQDPADDAWNRGDHETARALYAERVAVDSSDVRALHRLALLFAWNREFTPSLALFDRLLDVVPDNVEAQVDRARVLSWASRFDESVAAYADVLRQRPTERQARLGLAQVLSWSGRLDSATVVYEDLLADDPRDLDALRGIARATAWSGDLKHAEMHWREALEAGGDDGATLIGLSQTLRWQGRAGEARDALERVPLDQRSMPEYVDESRWVDVALSPTVAPSVTYEWDSDGNEMMTVALRGSHPVTTRARIELAGYLRTTWDDPPANDPQYDERLLSWGVTLGGRYVFAPGWAVGAGAGLSSTNATDAWTEPLFFANVSSPSRNRVAGRLSFTRSAFDPTRDLVERGVTFTETSASITLRPADRWGVDAGVAYGIFDGSESNGRLLGHATGNYRVTPSWAALARIRSFGFEKSRGTPGTAGYFNDSYFNPAFYFLGEVFPRWQPLRGPWHLSAEFGLGIEHIDIGPGQTPTTRWPTYRGSVRAAYDLAPGRQISLAGMYTDNAGPFAGNTPGYRYVAATLAGSWAF